MPDPVTNPEIEDVLTSIRRLVSENRSVAPAAAPSVVEVSNETQDRFEQPEDTLPSALVLTPALRVTEPEDVFEDDTASDTHGENEEDDNASAFEDALDASPDWNDEPVEDDEPIENADADVEDEDVFASEDIFAQESFQNSADDDDSQDDMRADLEVPEEHDFEEEQDETSTGAVGDSFEAADDQDAVEDIGDLETVGEDGEAPFDFQQVLNSRIVQWRDSGSDEGVEEPDAPGDSDYAGTNTQAEAWKESDLQETDDHRLHSFEQSLHAEIIDEVEATLLPDLGEVVDEPAVIDEEILREMVADIVRQELQGALGERITRNVRKLVRREIHRALAAHDLD
ncbi:hypothetical protein [Shimia sp.]|uniref:hypothetical protein n=1 Tax=Shimia sp. TaxID=1954381 RepID=UPI003299A7FD